MNNLQNLPLFTYLVLWVASRMCYPKNVTSTSFVSMLDAERETLKGILRTFDLNKPNGKIAGYMVRYLTSYCDKRITLINEWEKFMELNITVTFVPFKEK